MDAAIDLQTWQQAFEEHPISTTRAIEKQLRASVANNREKLRVLVGGNYRELLSTAEQIVALDAQTKSAESHISEIGQQCQPPSQQRLPDPKAPLQTVIAQLRLLQRCIAAAKSALNKVNLLQSGQLLVVSRLLVKSLSEQDSSLKCLASLRGSIASLRRQLLRKIEPTLTSPHLSFPMVVKGACAYCLITSASFQDVFKLIQRSRLEKLRKSLDQENLVDRHVVQGLQYHVASLKLLAALTGRAMTDALGNLQKRPILQEHAMTDLELLDLKAVSNLIPEEIQSFVPYFKRTPFSAEEVRSTLLNWSSDASSVISEGLERLVSQQTKVVDVLALRKTLYTVLLPVYFSTAGSSPLRLMFHRVLSKRVEALCRDHIAKLQTLVNVSESTNFTPNQGTLWQADVAKMSLNNGAVPFLHQVHRRRRGTSPRLAQVSRAVNAWIAVSKELFNAFQGLGHTRWRDIVEEPDEEQEEEAETLVQSLSRDDRDLYLSQLQSALKQGLEELEDTMSTTMLQSIERKTEARTAIDYLRTIRELVGPLRETFTTEVSFKKLNELVPRLHEVIAAEIVSQVTIARDEAIESKPQQGSLSTDNLPSPRTFGFLRKLCAAMFELGRTDIWSPAAVRVVKHAVAEEVFSGELTGAYVESEFDKDYLAAALRPSSTLTLAGPSDQRRPGREYWDRTRLLFGVLSE